MSQVTVGIDISKSNLDVFILPMAKTFRVANSLQGIDKLCTVLKDFPNPSVVIEATGGYEKLLSKSLYKSGYIVAKVNPSKIRYFAKACGISAKTDKLDAKVIAIFGETMKPRIFIPVSKEREELELYVKRREQLVKLRKQEKCHLEKHQEENAITRSIKKHIKLLDKEILELKSIINKILDKIPESKILCEELGVGEVTSSVLLSQLSELGRLSNKEISSLVGVAPFSRESGAWCGKRSIRGGRKRVRNALHMACRSAVAHNKKIREYYERLRKCGKPWKVAMTACMRKLLIILNAKLSNFYSQGEKVNLSGAVS